MVGEFQSQNSEKKINFIYFVVFLFYFILFIRKLLHWDITGNNANYAQSCPNIFLLVQVGCFHGVSKKAFRGPMYGSLWHGKIYFGWK